MVVHVFMTSKTYSAADVVMNVVSKAAWYWSREIFWKKYQLKNW